MKKYYIAQVLCHKWFIVVAGLKVGGFPLWRLIIHDWTKFLPVEFGVYRRRFTGKAYSKEEWDRAWAHHTSSNPHHYQYWICEGVPQPMPEIYAKEMAIDWMAAARGYHGSWDIQDWLDREHEKMPLHPETIERLKPILRSQGFRWPEEERP